MINTGYSDNTSFDFHGIMLIDDINNENKDSVSEYVKSCALYIEEKFSLPPASSKTIIARTKLYNSVSAKIEQMRAGVKQNKYKEFSTETQFNNFVAKIDFWMSASGMFYNIAQRMENSSDNIRVTIKNSLSKHEAIFVSILSELGIDFLIIDKNGSKELLQYNGQNNLTEKKYNTNENIDINNIMQGTSITVSQNGALQVNAQNKFKNIYDIEKALYEESSTDVKAYVKGIGSWIDTSNFYAKLSIESRKNNSWLLVKNGFEKPSYEQTSKIQRSNNDNHDYIVETYTNYVKTCIYQNEIKNIIKQIFNSGDKRALNGQVLYNKLIYTICVINNIFKKFNEQNVVNNIHIIYYGSIVKTDINTLEVLSQLKDISLVIACSDKSKALDINGIEIVELESSCEVFDMPEVDTRDNASTMAATAERRINETLFSGDTLGMYKPGQFRTCNTVNFSTTYDEIKMWWNKDIYLRPSFESHGDTAVVPTIFKVIKGCNGSNEQYIREIQQYCCGKTILCINIVQLENLSVMGMNCDIKRGTDIKNTKFDAQKPFFENNRINKKRIKEGVNYKYGFLDISKQDLILDKIEEVIVSDKVNKAQFNTEQDFIDEVLNVGLNLNMNVLQNIQWFEFYTYNPNVVVILQDERQLTTRNFITLALLQSLGFDVLVFVPTRYTSIENFVGKRFAYDTNVIGEANYNISTDEILNIQVSNNVEIEDTSGNNSNNTKKQGLFSKLFGK